MTGGTVDKDDVTLSQLGLRAPGGRDPRITGLSIDSRTVKPGHLFAALPGSKANGSAYAADAEKRGAIAIIAGIESPVPGVSIPVLRSITGAVQPTRRYLLALPHRTDPMDVCMVEPLSN